MTEPLSPPPGAVLLGRRIKAARYLAGYSQTELAAALKVNQTTVSKWERGLHPPQYTHRRQLALVLGGKPADYEEDMDENDEEDFFERERRRLNAISAGPASGADQMVEDNPGGGARPWPARPSRTRAGTDGRDRP